MPQLSPKREKFCQEYLIDLNATQAAIRSGYSIKTAGSIGGEILQKPEIKARIDELMAERATRCQVSQDDVVRELKRLGFSDMRKFAKWDGDKVEFLDSSDLTEDESACVESVSQTTSENGGSHSIKLHNKTKSLELLARHLGMLHDKMDHTTKGKEIKQPVFHIQNSAQQEKIEKLISNISNHGA